MRLLPLGLTANAASWRHEAASLAGGQASLALARDGHVCRFCGLASGPWAEVFHRNGDHADDSLDNLAAACPACHACQHLGRDGGDQEYLVVWLPHLTQAALNHLVRGIHHVFADHGEVAHMAAPPSQDTFVLRSAYAAYRALAACSSIAQASLGTSSPRLLGEALLSLPPSAASHATALVDGLRLLSRGRLFRNGVDVYPDCLECWASLQRET